MAGERRGPEARHVAAVVAGNALEFYDFLTYAFFAVDIGKVFFPAANPASSLLLSLATFGAGFFTRPIGGMALGALGDRIGRRAAMSVSFGLMGVAILGMVVTPGYAEIGVAAPVLVLAFRLLQGFALGGEVGPTTAFLVEACPPARRGLYGSLQGATQYVAVVGAGAVGTGLTAVLPPGAVQAWGWRLAFLLGALIVPFGLVVRRGLPETLTSAAPDEPAGGAGGLRPHLRTALLGLVMMAGATIATYVVLYIPTFAKATLGLPAGWSFAATAVIGVVGTAVAVIAGAASDRLGRKPVMIAGAALMLLGFVPGFMLAAKLRTLVALLAMAGLLTVPLAMLVSVVIVAVAEALPRRIRSGALATLYAVAIAAFGGTTQFAVALIGERTGDPLSPAYYASAAVAAALIAALASRETVVRINGDRLGGTFG